MIYNAVEVVKAGRGSVSAPDLPAFITTAAGYKGNCETRLGGRDSIRERWRRPVMSRCRQ